jgi:hypothetical protein
MALLLVREKLASMAIVELLAKAMRRLVREQIQQAHSVEPAALHLAAEKQLARATLQRALFALAA